MEVADGLMRASGECADGRRRSEQLVHFLEFEPRGALEQFLRQRALQDRAAGTPRSHDGVLDVAAAHLEPLGEGCEP